MIWIIVLLIIWFLIGFLPELYYMSHEDDVNIADLLLCVLFGCIGIFGALFAWTMFGDFDGEEIIVFKKREKK